MNQNQPPAHVKNRYIGRIIVAVVTFISGLWFSWEAGYAVGERDESNRAFREQQINQLIDRRIEAKAPATKEAIRYQVMLEVATLEEVRKLQEELRKAQRSK